MLRGGRERLRPILMTAITTLVAPVPIAVQRPDLAGMYYYSMALVIMGGSTAATLAEDSFAAVGRGVVGVWSWVRPWRRR
ncbi:MAG: efflux RND transporter permease subunit, partial [Deltaproteobacteria bacterium]|nr:efflux RND transporter permease subunit [Deltaproteobacteria bacterium]